MRSGEVRLGVLAIVALLLAACAPASGRYLLLVSKLSDRSFATNLQGQSVAADIYVFLTPADGVKEVLFYIDNPAASGKAAGIESGAPLDLAGGPDYAANAYDTRQLSDGRHTVTALVTQTAGGTIKVTASFDVKNKTPSNSAIYWGVAIEGVPWDMTGLATWEKMVGKQPPIVHFWLPWSEQGELYPFQPALLSAVREHGSIPMITWLPERASQSADQPNYRLAAIAGGKYDAYLRDWAKAAKAWGHPFFLRFGHEMNGFWFPWGEDANANRRGDFVKAWRHVVDIFRQQGATNVSWVWCPNIDWSGSGWPTMQELYPGDNYVDWTCLDGYNWGPDKGGWKSFNDIFRWSYENIRSFAPAKPMMLGEFASSEKGGSKAAWITGTFGSEVPFDFPGLKAVVWYNLLMDQDWRVESSPQSMAAFKAAIGSSYYSTNLFGNLNASPVPALK